MTRTDPALPCGNCGEPMRVLQLAGHYGRQVEIDLCPACHLVWFDQVETARLAAPGLLSLIGEMAATQALAHRPLRADLGCLRCRAPLRTVHNQSRWGRSMQLECSAQRHGAYQSFAQFLSEKGLARPMSSADRAQLLRRDGRLHCVNCGGEIGAQAQSCPWCQSVPSVIDVARLAQALDPEGATAGHAVHRSPRQHSALHCLACGAAQPAGPATWACAQCGATLAAAGLAEAHQRVQELGPALRAHADKPSPEIVARRLQSQDAGMQRQRERAKEMQAEADARMGGQDPVEWGIDQVPHGRWIAWGLFLLALLAGWFQW